MDEDSVFHAQPRRDGDIQNILDHEIKLKLVIRLRSEGKSSYQIGELLGVPDRTVRNWLNEATTMVRATNREFINEMFAIHQHRLEALYQEVVKKLAEHFSTDLVKTAILLLDRQSKLLGLDSQRTRLNNDWLEQATDDELIAEAKRLGVPIPQSFETKVKYGDEGRTAPGSR